MSSAYDDYLLREQLGQTLGSVAESIRELTEELKARPADRLPDVPPPITWVSCGDILPPLEQLVLCYGDKRMYVAYRKVRESKCGSASYWTWGLGNEMMPKFWRPLPDPPA